jgi:hypothetical protein
MRNNKDLRPHQFCRACGLIVVAPICPFCSSTIDEPVIYESKIGYRSRLTSITGVCLLIVAGVTPAVVSARESVETATITAETAVVSTIISTASVMESTPTTLVQSSDKNTTQNTKTPTTQKPKNDKNKEDPVCIVREGVIWDMCRASRPDLYPPPTAPTTTTTTTVLPGPHGKTDGTTILWKDSVSGLSIGVSVGKHSSGSDYVLNWSSFPSAKSLDSACSASNAPISKYESFWSIDGGTTIRTEYGAQFPSKEYSCEASAIGLSVYQFSDGKWLDFNRNVVAAPVNFYAKIKLTNLQNNIVIQSPWVLVDWSKVP